MAVNVINPTLLVALLLLIQVSTTRSQDSDVPVEPSCPSVCTCKDRRRDSQGTYKVDCVVSSDSASDPITSLKSLGIPSVTTQL